MVEAFPLVEISGPARTRGRHYGEQARSRIRRGIEHYSEQAGRLSVSRSQIEDVIHAYLPTIKAFEPAFCDEMQGIAEGAGVSYENVVLLNARTEIMKLAEKPALRASLLESGVTPDGCTGVIVMPGATASGRLIHAQNWDWKAECAETGVVLRIEREDGPDILTFTEAGALARAGMNGNGVAVTGNYLESDRDYRSVGIPLALIRRKALECDNLAMAMSTIYASPKSASNNMMMSHKGGVAINFECAPDETFQVHPEGGLLVHANHWISPVALSKLQDRGVVNMPSTLYRGIRARDLLAPHVGRIDVDAVRAALLDDFETPWSLCQPRKRNARGVETATVAMIVMEPETGWMQVAPLPSEGNAAAEYTIGRKKG